MTYNNFNWQRDRQAVESRIFLFWESVASQWSMFGSSSLVVKLLFFWSKPSGGVPYDHSSNPWLGEFLVGVEKKTSPAPRSQSEFLTCPANFWSSVWRKPPSPIPCSQSTGKMDRSSHRITSRCVRAGHEVSSDWVGSPLPY